ncbi:MAG: hypothetical protein ACRDPF_30250, partial [Streptosporangiaceae bacterium]
CGVRSAAMPRPYRRGPLPTQIGQHRQHPAVVLRHQGQHGQLTFITTYTAIDPPRSAGATLTLDGFFGWPLSAVAS